MHRVLRAAVDLADLDRSAVAERAGLGPRKTGRILNLLDLMRKTRGRTSVEARTEQVIELAEAHRRLEVPRSR